MSGGLALRGSLVTLRQADDADLSALIHVLEEPEVSRWWGSPPAPFELRKEFLGDGVTTLVIETRGETAGLIQFYEQSEAAYRSAGIDIAIATAHQGRGLGTDSVRTLARFLFEEHGHHRLTIDPAAANTRAIACYTKVGFRPVGVMRQYERGGDGTWHDNLLMDMLRHELNEAR